MPLYRFGIRDGERFEDHDGINLPDDVTARAHAMGIIQELRNADETSWRGFIMEVERDGRLVWKIPFK